MNKHTPGPWLIEPQWSERCGGSVAVVNREVSGWDWDVCSVHSSEANARLIAAAPDLLEAAQLALQIAESWIHDQLDGTSSIDGALLHLDPVRAAIARARGEA